MKVFIGPLVGSLVGVAVFYLVSYLMNNINDHTWGAGVAGGVACFFVMIYQMKKKEALAKRA